MEDNRTSGFTSKVVLVIFRELLNAFEFGVLSDKRTLLERSLFLLETIGFTKSGDAIQEVRFGDTA